MANIVASELAKFAEEMRGAYRASIPAAGEPDPVSEVRSLSIRASEPPRDIPVRVYVPQGADGKKKLPVVLFAHGGGFLSGDFDTHEVLVRAVANGTQALVVAVDYRLAPEHPFPAGLEDVYAVLSWLADNAGEIGGDGRSIAVAGDSAGATLVTGAALLARDRQGPKIAAQWLMYASLSNKLDTESWKQFGDQNFPTRAVMAGVMAAYVPEGTSPYAPYVAPLWAVHTQLPPALIQVGEFDPLRDENTGYAAALQKAGVAAEARVYKGAQHGFIQFYKDKEQHLEGEKALRDGIEFVRGKLGLG